MVVGLLIALLLLGGALFAFTSLNVASVRVDRDRDTKEVLAQAKDALIAYAVSHLTRPGQLPCPDVNDDGIEDLAGTCTSLIGRLPWVTLGLPDLRDDSGERLWYAVSADFGNGSGVPLNSDTAYRENPPAPTANQSLTLTGTTPAANLVAIVISPGATLTRTDGRAQVRGCGAMCDPKDFLDIASGEDNVYENRAFVAASRSASFNDTLMPVFSDDIMRLVERRAARELAQHLRNHFEAWENSPVLSGANNGFYPFAVPWNDPSSTPVQLGTNNTPSGLLPLSTAPVTWSNVSPGCSGAGTTILECNALVVCLPIVGCLLGNLSGRVENIATRFLDAPTAGNVDLLGLSLGGSGSWTMDEANRRLEFSYGGFLSAGIIHIRVAAPAVSSWVGGWLGSNNWHQNAYYAFAPGFAMNGNNLCGVTCFSIANTSPVTTNKHAIVVMTGRSLSQAAIAQDPRPVGVLPAEMVQYLEDGNSDVTATAFETKARTAAFNDTPVAVRP